METIIAKILNKRPPTGGPPMSKELDPPTEKPVEESPKLNLDQETIQILKDDKIATGG